MNVESAEVSLAYTYAWWLTGDETAARAAVLAAVDRPEVPGADADLLREILLRRVRAAAIAEPTMCPASELALLHDGIGLGLDSAAGLVAIRAREARTELAHGRLEALGPGAEFQITEPERLGGLAVGNPADVAAARQNPQLGQLRKMILAGRDELVSLSEIDVPADLLADVAARGRGDAAAESSAAMDDWFSDADALVGDAPGAGGDVDDLDGSGRSIPVAAAPLVDGDGGAGSTDAQPYDEVDGEEIDLTAQIGDAPSRGLTAPSQRRVNLGWLMVGLVILIGVVVLLTSGVDDTAPADTDPVAATDPAPTDTSTDPTDPAAPPTDDATPEGTAPPTEPVDSVVDLVVDRAGVSVGIGSDPDYDNPVAGPFDPVSITVEYEGAADGDAFDVDWTVDGVPFSTERVDLSPLLTSARFSRQVPEEGWPPGQHILTFAATTDGTPLGEARFVVTADDDAPDDVGDPAADAEA